MDIEKEVRYKINEKDLENIIQKTQPYIPKNDMLDITFGYNGFKSLQEYGFICRVRQKPNKSTLEVKKRIGVDWLEQEILLDDISSGINYFKLVGMEPYMFLKRFREVRKYKNLKIFIDQIEILGNYVEIEYQDSPNGLEELKDFLNVIKITNSTQQELYGDIICKQLQTDPSFNKIYNEALNKIIKKFIDKE